MAHAAAINGSGPLAAPLIGPSIDLCSGCPTIFCDLLNVCALAPAQQYRNTDTDPSTSILDDLLIKVPADQIVEQPSPPQTASSERHTTAQWAKLSNRQTGASIHEIARATPRTYDPASGHRPDALMSADPLSPVAPARVRILLLPVGRIKRHRFLEFASRLRQEHIVRLGDISPDVSSPEKSEYT